MCVRQYVCECEQVRSPANNAKLWTISTVVINLNSNLTIRVAEQRLTVRLKCTHNSSIDYVLLPAMLLLHKLQPGSHKA